MKKFDISAPFLIAPSSVGGGTELREPVRAASMESELMVAAGQAADDDVVLGMPCKALEKVAMRPAQERVDRPDREAPASRLQPGQIGRSAQSGQGR